MLRVVSLFCGIGGSDMGLYAAADELGIEVQVVAAYDSWDKAVKVYNANHRHPVAQVADVKQMTRADLPPHDLIIGGPPCQNHSMAGKRNCECHKGGIAHPNCCLADFVRLAGDTPYIMENVASRLINAPWNERLCAADFGDVTSRKRWFYSNYLLHVVPTPGLRRIRDIRDHDEDERVLRKRGYWTGDEMQAVAEDDDVLPTLTASNFHGSKNNGSGRPTKGSKIRCKAGIHGHYDSLDSLDSLTAHSWHGHDLRGKGKLLEIVTHRPRTNEQGGEPYATLADPDGVFGSLTADAPRAFSGDAVTQSEARLRLGLRGHSASASAFEDDEVLGSVLSNSYHANEESKLVGCRNPSILEMARAHSIPDSFDWAGATKSDKGKMIANSWPAMLSKAVCKAMLIALTQEREAKNVA